MTFNEVLTQAKATNKHYKRSSWTNREIGYNHNTDILTQNSPIVQRPPANLTTEDYYATDWVETTAIN